MNNFVSRIHWDFSIILPETGREEERTEEGRGHQILHFMGSSTRHTVGGNWWFGQKIRNGFPLPGTRLVSSTQYSPGTVSGKVSFCIVCIAFSALRARYHLKCQLERLQVFYKAARKLLFLSRHFSQSFFAITLTLWSL